MDSLQNLIDQVRAILILTEDKKLRHEIYNDFINECKVNNLNEDDFYKKVLRPAHKSINWSSIEEEIQLKVETQKKLNAELAELENQIQSAPIYINRLIKIAFEDGVVEADELIKIFEKAATLSQDTRTIANKIDALLDKKKYKSYPNANLDAPTLKDVLCSTNWYSEKFYTKLTTPPPKPFSWKIVIVAILLLLIVGCSYGYFLVVKPWLLDKNSERLYVITNSLKLRSSKFISSESNILATIPYGNEIIVYAKDSAWADVKVDNMQGFMSIKSATSDVKYLVSKKDFYESDAIFAEPIARELISLSRYRLSLLNYFRNNNLTGKLNPEIKQELGILNVGAIWQVFAEAKESEFNTAVTGYFTGTKSKDFACIIKNISSGERKLLIFCYDDSEKEIFQKSFPVDEGYGLKSCLKGKNVGKWLLNKKQKELLLTADAIQIGPINTLSTLPHLLLIYDGISFTFIQQNKYIFKAKM